MICNALECSGIATCMYVYNMQYSVCMISQSHVIVSVEEPKSDALASSGVTIGGSAETARGLQSFRLVY